MELAAAAAAAGEVPVGAVVVRGGEVIAAAHNCVEAAGDGCAHAEILALQQAARHIGDWRLNDCVLYVTKEPCAMCAGAAVNCRLGRIVYAMADARAGAAGSALDVTGFAGMLHQVPVTGGVLEEEAKVMMQSFFRRRREEQRLQKLQDGPGK